MTSPRAKIHRLAARKSLSPQSEVGILELAAGYIFFSLLVSQFFSPFLLLVFGPSRGAGCFPCVLSTLWFLLLLQFAELAEDLAEELASASEEVPAGYSVLRFSLML